MGTHDAPPGVARLKTLHVSTRQGRSGVLSKESQHVFTYATDVIAGEDQHRAIALSMPVQPESYKSTPMFPVFHTSLPEGFLAERIAERFSKTMRMDEMALLALSGGNAIGRIRVSASADEPADPTGTESLKEILQHQGSQDLFQDLCDKYLISFGIAGVQPKVVLDATDHASTSHRGTHHPEKADIGAKATLRGRKLIVKVAGDDFPHLAENEFHCLSIARTIKNLTVPAFWISEDRKRFVIERFDVNPAGQFLGFEDMVSIQGKVNERKYEGSYEKIALAIQQNASPGLVQSSLEEFFRSLVLSMVMRNGDGHLKNFGLVYTDPTTDDCRLAPLYDIVCTTVYLPRDLPALSIGGIKSWPDRKALLSFGRKHCRMDAAAEVIDEVADLATQYRPDSDESGIWRKMKEQVDNAAFALAGKRAVHGL